MSESLSLSSAAESPGAARRFVTMWLQQWGYHTLIDAAALVTSELATNAVEHTGQDFTVALDDLGDGVHISVGDVSRGMPVQRDATPLQTSGRGIHLVDELADTWGITLVPGDGKLVWCDLHEAARMQA